MLLNKCCCCCSLKYGYFAYGILSMAGRLMACVSIYHASKIYVGPFTTSHETQTQILTSQLMSISAGWVITSAVSLFFTLKGIVQKRSILIYPYLTVLIVELIGLIFTGIIFAITVSAYGLIILPIAAAIIVYEFWCLFSLYKHIKANERMRYVGDMVPLKAV